MNKGWINMSFVRICGCAFLGILMTCAGVPAAEEHSSAWDHNWAQNTLTPWHIAKIRSVSSVHLSPDGQHIAYRLSVQRKPIDDDSGPAWSELHVVDQAGLSRPFITGQVNIGDVAWRPDGSGISYTAKRNDDQHSALYVIPIDGGESRRILSHETGISSYTWSPDGRRVAFIATEKEDGDRKESKDKGFNAEVYEEDWRVSHVRIAEIGEDETTESRILELNGIPSELHWSPAGNQLVVALASSPLIDERYMRRDIHIVDADTGQSRTKFDIPGKLGPIVWAPDGKHIAMLAGETINDPSDGVIFIGDTNTGAMMRLHEGYEGHYESIAWQDNNTLMFIASEGVEKLFGEMRSDGSQRNIHIPTGGPILNGLSLSKDGQSAAFTGQTPRHPSEVFVLKHGQSRPQRLTHSNPWLEEIPLAKQEVVRYTARDGLEIEGLLIRPLNEKRGQKHPLILVVHGGPEAHYSNGWITRYSSPGQMAAARGFAVFYPNYRGSTGRGVAFSMKGQNDYAGGEFDDLVDAVDHLVKTGLVDEKKVGITGGSYGGYASAWAATKQTKHFAASVMNVGVSELISKAGTTDIPTEMYHVHARIWPWEAWDWYRERSPVYYVEQARTPLLILHGKEDSRVHPSQSLVLYRYLKILNKVPVRLVLYPGEGHGNRKSAGRLDYSLRMMRWLEHYLTGPGGDPPAYDIDPTAPWERESDDETDPSVKPFIEVIRPE
jgi:dipeptidyl aminopeptidase/acylaminoacyl peptidase